MSFIYECAYSEVEGGVARSFFSLPQFFVFFVFLFCFVLLSNGRRKKERKKWGGKSGKTVCC